MKITGATILLALCFTTAQAEPTPLRKLSQPEQAEQIVGAEKAVLIYRDGLLAATAFIRQQTNLFPEIKGDYLPLREDKEILWQAWVNYLDYLLALDSLDHYYRRWRDGWGGHAG